MQIPASRNLDKTIYNGRQLLGIHSFSVFGLFVFESFSDVKNASSGLICWVHFYRTKQAIRSMCHAGLLPVRWVAVVCGRDTVEWYRITTEIICVPDVTLLLSHISNIYFQNGHIVNLVVCPVNCILLGSLYDNNVTNINCGVISQRNQAELQSIGAQCCFLMIIPLG